MISSSTILRVICCLGLVLTVSFAGVHLIPVETTSEDTMTVEYWVDGAVVSLEVPSGDVPSILPRFGTPTAIFRFVTPDDPSVRQLADFFQDRLSELTEKQRADVVLWYVGDMIDYKADEGPMDSWQFPCETLRKGAGDCEDRALLLVSVYLAMGYDAILVSEPNHMSAAVALSSGSGQTVMHEGRTYYTADPGHSYTGGSEPSVLITYEGAYDNIQILMVDLFSILSAVMVLFAVRPD